MSASCPSCGLNDLTELAHWDSLHSRGGVVAARDGHLCVRCNLIFDGTRREWEHGTLGSARLADRRRGLAGRLDPLERVAGLEHVARLREAFGDIPGAQRCASTIDQISRGVL